MNSHFVQVFPLCAGTHTLSIFNIYPWSNSRIVRYNSGIGGQSENSHFAQDNSGIVLILTLRRTYTQMQVSLPQLFTNISFSWVCICIIGSRSSLIRIYTVCLKENSDQGLHCLPEGEVRSGSTMFAGRRSQIRVYTVCLKEQWDQGLHCLHEGEVRSRSTLFAWRRSPIRAYTVCLKEKSIRIYTVCLKEQSDQVYTICLKEKSDQGLHCLPEGEVRSGSTLFAWRRSQIRVYTVSHSVCIFWMHYCTVRSSGWLQKFFLPVPISWEFYFFFYSNRTVLTWMSISSIRSSGNMIWLFRPSVIWNRIERCSS